MLRKRSLCHRPSREMVTPRGSYTSTPAHSLISRLHVAVRHVDLRLSPTSVDCLSPFVGSWPPLAILSTFHPFRTLRQELVHPKDPVPANHRKGVVYSIPCAECPPTYIGQTGRSLDHRLREHRRALKNGDLGSLLLLNMCSPQTIKWIYPRPW